MVTGDVLVIVLVAALTWFVGAEAVKGVKKLGHGVKVGIGRLVHPHPPVDPPPEE